MPILANIKKQDWILNSAILFLALAGSLSLLSSAKSAGGGLFYQHLVWYVVGLAVMVLVSQIDWRPLINRLRLINGIYIIAVILLILTYFLAPSIRGAKSWLIIGPLNFQASEFTKLALIIVFSSFWARAHIGIAHLKNLATSFFYFVIPVALVVIQPDLGTALILFGIWFGYLLISGIKWKHLIIALVIFSIAGTFLWASFLEDYHKARIIGLFYPEKYALGVNYGVIQSKIAIGSAGFLGKGFGGGTQVQLGFLPEAQADFIFAAFIEEWGLLGGFLVILAFLILMIRIIQIGLISENNFARFICLGVVIMFILHFILNIGSNLGILPVVGVPFPFLSYGGSNLLTNFILIGIIQGIVLRSKF